MTNHYKLLFKGIKMSNVKNSIDYKMFSYTGSKHKFGNEFNKILNKMSEDRIKVKYYIEGFSGSLMSMFHNLKKIDCEYIVVNDFNSKLINLYKQIKSNPQLVIEGYKMIEEKFNNLLPKNCEEVRVYPKEKRDDIRKNEKFYKYIRNLINTSELDWCHSSMMLFILNHNFNGMYSENKKGHTNVSFNWNTKPVDTNKIETNLYNLSEFFNSHKVIFENMDIDNLISKYNDKDTFIYLDPPYINSDIQYLNKREKQDSFNHVYVHQKLLHSCSKYKYVMYSNNHHKEFISLCDGFINFDRQKFNKKSKKSVQEILSYKVNTPVNNTTYVPEEKTEEVIRGEVVNNVDYTPVLNTGTCFSGLGCPEYVLKELNIPHNTKFVCDIDKYCRQTLKRNYNPENIYDDITTLSFKSYPKDYIDLYVWGSPCQDFSQSNNNREGLKGSKSSLFFEGLRILKETKPKYSIFENVQGVLSSNKGEDFKEMMKLFEELGTYNIYHKKINPINIGGNTHRTRVFVVLIRKEIDIEFNFPKNVKSNKCIKDCLIPGDYKYLDKSEYSPWETPVEKQRGKLRKDFILNNEKLRDEVRRVFNINYPSPTILRSGVVHINDGVGVRKMVPEELKFIQGLDNLDLSHLSDSQKRSQLGNTMEFETMKQLISKIVRINNLHHKTTKVSNNTDYQPHKTEKELVS